MKASLFSFSFSLAVLVLVVSASNGEDAAQLNKDAITIAQQGRLQEALELFHRAVRLDPENAEFINNLGVTEMRLGMFAEAKTSFQRALEIDPYNAEANDNIIELQGFMERQGMDVDEAWFWEEEGEEIQHHVEPLPRIPLSELYLPENEKYAEGKTPFILTEAVDGSWENTNGWSLDYFKREFPNAHVDFYPHNMASSNVRPYIVPMMQALEEFERPSGAFRRDPRHPGTYMMWNMNLDDWEALGKDFGVLPELFRSDEAWIEGCLGTRDLRNEFHIVSHWRMLLIGTEGAGMFNHQDTLRTSSYQVQLRGNKTWHLCGPDQNPFMYNAGDVNTFRPNYARFPLAKKLRCYLDTVQPGEMVFYQKDWWHQTYNSGDLSVAVSSTLVDRYNFREVAEEFQADCSREKARLIRPSDTLCKELNKCYEWWETAYAGAFEHITAPNEAVCNL